MPRRDAGGGDELAVLDPARLLHPADLRPLLGDPLEEHLVRRGAFAVEQAGARQQRGARAYGHDHVGLGDAPAQEAEDLRVLGLLARSETSRHQEEIQARAVVEVVARQHVRTLCAGDRANLLCQHRDVDLALEHTEHLERAEDVEQLELRVEHDPESFAGWLCHRRSSSANPVRAPSQVRPSGRACLLKYMPAAR
jgi:hypothetical protein